MHNSKVRVVCKDCNSGWLSRIQESAKPILIPLIQGKPTTLGTEAQQIVANWCAMATMTGEFLDNEPVSGSIAISQAEREWLWKTGTPPSPGWRIWIARYQRHKWPGRWVHLVVPMIEAKNVPRSALAEHPPPNTQTTTFVIGDLYAHVMSTSSNPDLVNRWVWPICSRHANLLVQIWPARESVIAWPPESLTDDDADCVATAYDRVIDAASQGNLGRRIFYPTSFSTLLRLSQLR